MALLHLQLWVVRLIEADQNTAWEIRRAPPAIAELTNRSLDEIADGTGPVADLSYSSAFPTPRVSPGNT